MNTHGMMIIMLSGWAGSGKDAAASLLLEEMDCVRFAFADSLKLDAHFVNQVRSAGDKIPGDIAAEEAVD